MRYVALLVVVLAACAPTVEPFEATGPMYFDLEFIEPPGGLDPATPLPFETDAREYRLRATARGYDREPMDWSGTLALHTEPGQLEGSSSISMVAGEATFTADVALAFGQLRIWVSDEDGGSYAVGVAPTVHVAFPTVAELQRPLGSDDASPLSHQYVQLRGYDGDDPREMVVTTVTNDGFYVTDRSDGPGEFNSLFVFTFSRPDHIEVGARLKSLAGIVAEFIGYTELQFPTYEVESLGHDPGQPVLLDPAIVCDDAIMEGYEASVVRIEGITSDFRRASDCDNYLEFAQWPASLPGECDGEPSRITIVNANTVPSYGFPECEAGSPPAERQLEYLIGVLRHTAPADPPWIVEARSCLDFPEADRPEDCPGLLERPLSGPRIAPPKYYRDIETC